jgi:hypothetical protein
MTKIMRGLCYGALLSCAAAVWAAAGPASGQAANPEKSGTPATTKLQLDAAALQALQSGTAIVAELSFDVKRLSPTAPPEGDIRVTLGEAGNPAQMDDRTVGLISLVGEGEDGPVTTKRNVVQIDRVLRTMNLAQIARDGSVPITLSIVDGNPGQSNVEISNVKVKLRR